MENINTQEKINPLSSFGRKPKLELNLPSEGRWYPNGSLTLNENKTVSIRSMTGADDLKFKAGDVLLNGENVYELILSCVPNIKNPKVIPTIDLDALLLAIRWASYGPSIKQVIKVPNTALVRTINLNISKIIENLPSVSSEPGWDNELIIQDADNANNTIKLLLKPITLESLFKNSAAIQEQRNSINADNPENINAVVHILSDMAIELIVESIAAIEFVNQKHNSITDTPSILKFINNLDLSYFNAIKDHINKNREIFTIKTEIQHSTEDEIKSGAPTTWQSDLIFAGTSFFND